MKNALSHIYLGICPPPYFIYSSFSEYWMFAARRFASYHDSNSFPILQRASLTGNRSHNYVVMDNLQADFLAQDFLQTAEYAW